MILSKLYPFVKLRITLFYAKKRKESLLYKHINTLIFSLFQENTLYDTFFKYVFISSLFPKVHCLKK